MKDEEFIRGNVPMTKEEIRSIVLSKLNLNPNDTFIDIGSGSGSVTIEVAKTLTKGKVFAIEQNEEAIGLIHKNINKHKLLNIEVIHSKAPQGMEMVTHANKFFIGGSGGNLDQILNLIVQKAKSNSIIVVTAIIVDTMINAYHFFKENNIDFELIQVAVNKVDPEKKVAMLFAQNPIFILTAQL